MRLGGREVRAVWWEGDEVGGRLVMVDQRLLPHRFATVAATSVETTAQLIRDMAVRGAPSIGAAAAFGMVLGRGDPARSASLLGAARPTARDLFTAVEWMRPEPTLDRATAYVDGVIDKCRRLGQHGAAVLADLAARKGRLNIMTHCHAGVLASVDHGTALAPVYAYAAGHPERPPFVWVDETRPRLQGALTAWELGAAGVAHRVAVDGAAGHLMARGEVDVVIVGADRIARNGDVANKVGTYAKAVVAAENGIPFYVAAPSTTFDAELADGAGIHIEERAADEVLVLAGQALFGRGTQAVNPAFDVTPARHITGYITEAGVLSRADLPRTLEAATSGQE